MDKMTNQIELENLRTSGAGVPDKLGRVWGDDGPHRETLHWWDARSDLIPERGWQ